MRSLMCVSVIACVARRLRPFPNYSRRRDLINLGLWRGLYKGGRVQDISEDPGPLVVRRSPSPLVSRWTSWMLELSMEKDEPLGQLWMHGT